MTDKRRTFRSAVWLSIDAGGASAISLAGLLITAAIIGAEDVGRASIVLAIVGLANFPVEALFSEALVQRKNLRSGHTNSAFWTIALLASVLTGVIVTYSPALAELYIDPSLSNMFIVSSVALPATAILSVQTSLLRRRMRFRTLALHNLASRAIGSTAALAVALNGYGAWSLIAQYVLSSLVFASSITYTTKWRPQYSFELFCLKQLLVFAVPETLSQFVAGGRGRLFLSLTGAFLPLEAVGQINMAFRIVDSIRSVVGSAAMRLCIVLFSRSQNNRAELEQLFLKASTIISSLTLPLFAAIAVTAPDAVRVVFGQDWQSLAFCLQALSLVSCVYFMRSAAYFMFTARGMPHVSLIIGLLVGIITFVPLIAVPPVSAEYAVVYWVIPSLIAAIVDSFITRKFLNISIKTQWTASFEGLLLGAVVGGALLVCRLLLLRAELSPAAVLLLEGLLVVFIAVVLMPILLRRWLEHGATSNYLSSYPLS